MALPAFSWKYFGMDPSLIFEIKAHVGYNFTAATDKTDIFHSFNINVPFSFMCDARFIEWFSLAGGTRYIYSVRALVRTLDIPAPDTEYSIFVHSFVMQFPFIVKFYPLARVHDRFFNLYLAVGLFFQTIPVAGYISSSAEGKRRGNAYTPSHPEMEPGHIYTKNNIGIHLAAGNRFSVNNTSYFGVELYFTYLLVPSINGYKEPSYSRGSGTLLEFTPAIGISLSAGFELLR